MFYVSYKINNNIHIHLHIHIIFNHIYQYYVFHIVKNIDDCPVSMNVKIQGLPGTGKIFIANTIRNIDINLNPMFFNHIHVVLRSDVCFINQWSHTSLIIQYSYWKNLS